MTLSGITLFGTDGDDSLVGSPGNDLISGLQGREEIYGLEGDDSINSGLGIDTVDGGSGFDTLSVDYSSSDPNPLGGPWWNDYVFDWNGFSRSWRMLSSISQTATGVYSGSFYKSDNSVNFSNIEAFSILGTSLSDGLLTGLAADSINSAAGDDVIFSGAGNDSIAAGDGNDWINSEAGDDFISADLGNDSILAGSGNDTILAGGGNDSLLGGDGNDSLIGGDGDDVISKGSGIDVIDGGNGYDRLIDADMRSRPEGNVYRDTGAAIPAITLPNGTIYKNIESFVNLTLGSGGDRIIYTSRENNIILAGGGNDNINPGLGLDSVDGGAGTDRLTINYSGISGAQGWYHWYSHWRNWGMTTTMNTPSSRERSGYFYVPGERVDFSAVESFTISGTPNADGVDTGDLNDRITGNGGDDVINSYAGSDWIDGGSGSDLIYAGAGIDTILGGEGTDSIWGGLGKDRIHGDSDADYLCGDDGDDTIYGGSGNDIFSPNPSEQEGNDVLMGDSGDDTFFDSIGTNTIDGGDGVDTLVFADLRNRTGGNTYVDSGLTYDPINLSDGGMIRNIEYFDSVFTSSGDDTFNFTTRRFNNAIWSGAGQDVINPGLGSDTVDGGEGHDRLVIDYSLSAGWQRDYFTWNSGYGRNWSTISDLSSSATGDYRGSISTTTDIVYFRGIESFSISGTAYADGILCGNGNDIINGRGGADVLIPGAGADTIILADHITEYYDDLNPGTDGSSDYAHITGLDSSDIIQLQSSAADYQITEGSGSSWIYRLKSDGEPSEMIAFIQDVTGLSLSSNQFIFV
jgi:Ca2+-binding RTX toxin-like protein